MADISVQKATLITTAYEGSLYVLYLPVFIASSVFTCRKARYSTLHARLQIVISVLFAGTTANLILDIYTANIYYLSPVFNHDTPQLLHVENVYNLLYCIRDGIFGLNLFIADALLVWRYYVFWNDALAVILFPLFLLTVEVSLGIAVIIFQVRIYGIQRDVAWLAPRPPALYVALDKVAVLNKAYYASTFAVNILLSVAIAWKIWSMLRSVVTGGHRIPKYSRISHTIALSLESGIIYSIIILLAIMPNNALLRDIAGVTLMICVALVPSVVILLVTVGKSSEFTTHGTDEVIPQTAIRFGTVPGNTHQEGSVATISVVLGDLGAPDNSGSKVDIETGKAQGEFALAVSAASGSSVAVIRE
ncbi:hypothetical protein GLOTRDRAFT_125146 [Gloeophyllum trabeum ATCC 11539]|uniref:Uncharacterized protein n=1 Tax=Gloeophyllum trabeum (strain ATCC 11539 / FP-39264 / Madison 617) TaxID=670483 RepID=S7RZE8_GLOTA|nr:uncharacterized protein GLOTRDRAFT_125146 [Gloeophyllum trabeum ATCC 11539]EPQ58819.1 hypothetical protein GLOTRDRAFT_125146 [Gloeophyllum trabeum ATCC 11539]